MIDLDITFFIQFVNFIITLLVLNLVLIKPIRGIIKKRKELMSSRMSEIEKFSSSAESKVADYEDQLDAARREANELRGQAKEAGSAKEQEIVGEAHTEATATLKSAREEISSQSQAAIGSLKGEIDKYAKMATDKILGQA